MSSQAEQAPSLLVGASSPAPSVQAAAVPQGYLSPRQGARLWFIDNLRVVLICGVVVAHLALTYGAFGGGWYQYRDPAPVDLLTSYVLTILSLIGISCGMGVFFLIAGYFTPGSYERKGTASFLRDRLVRLLIPLLLYDLLLDPLVVYIAGGCTAPTGASMAPICSRCERLPMGQSGSSRCSCSSPCSMSPGGR